MNARLKQKRPETEYIDGEGKKRNENWKRRNFGFSYSKVLILINIVGYFPLTFILITYTFQISEEYRVCASTIYTSTQFAQRLSSNQLSTIFDKNLKNIKLDLLWWLLIFVMMTIMIKKYLHTTYKHALQWRKKNVFARLQYVRYVQINIVLYSINNYCSLLPIF